MSPDELVIVDDHGVSLNVLEQNVNIIVGIDIARRSVSVWNELSFYTQISKDDKVLFDKPSRILLYLDMEDKGSVT